MKKLITVIAIMLLTLPTTFAQVNSQANQNAVLSMNNAIAITFTSTGNNVGDVILLPFLTTNDFLNGVTSSAQTLKVQSNKQFNVSIGSTTQYFAYTGTAYPTPNMPIASVLSFLISNNNTGGSLPYSSYASIPYSTATTIVNLGQNGGNSTFDVTYKATPGYAYPSGLYSAFVVYTATQL
jgi:hypothetical protein